jgi:hypothetical protein
LNERSLPPLGVPTLTEVIEWSVPTSPSPPVLDLGSLPLLPEAPAIDLTSTPDVSASAVRAQAADPLTSLSVPHNERRIRQIDEDILTQRVLEDLQRQVDLMLEFRLRAVMAPVVDQAMEVLRESARTELASTLHEIVARAVAQELIRHRAQAERGEGPA